MNSVLIPLLGSPSEVEAATRIRREWLYHCSLGLARSYPPEMAERAGEIMIACMNLVPHAAWWVENRELSAAFAPVWRAEMVKAGLMGT